MVSRAAWMRVVITVLAVLACVWIAYPGAFYFLNDDYYHIPLAAQGSFLHSNLVRPVSDLSLWLDHRFWGKQAFGYHLTNLLLHLADTWLVYLLALVLFVQYGARQGAAEKAWATAILFLLYPYHSEPLCWIIGRGGSLGALFFLIAVIAYLHRNKRTAAYLLSLIAFGIGFYTYESTWIFPGVAIALSFLTLWTEGGDTNQQGKAGVDKEAGSKERNYKGQDYKEQHYKRRFYKEAVFAGGTLVLLLLLLGFRHLQLTGGRPGDESAGLSGVRPGHLLYNLNALFARSVLPPMQSSGWFLIGYAVLIVLLLLVLYRLNKKGRGWVFPAVVLVCFIMALLPAIAFGISTHDTESERYLYLPSIFLVLWVVDVLYRSVEKASVRMVYLLVLFLAGGVCLERSAATYSAAGRIARVSINAVSAERATGQCYLINKPTKYKGALIFRYGFEHAASWMAPSWRWEAMTDVHAGAVRGSRAGFDYRETRLDPMAGLRSASIQGGEMLVTLEDTSFRFRPDKDLILYWTDSCIWKIRD